MSNYPDSSDIRKIKKWPYDDFKGLIEFVRPLVEPMGRVTVKRSGRVEIATGWIISRRDFDGWLFVAGDVRREVAIRKAMEVLG